MLIPILWLFLRIISMLVAGVASGVHPSQNLEKQVLLWPPSQPLDLWVDRTLISPLFRWDALHYQTIATQGYQISDGSTAFFPLYPSSAKVLVLLGLDPSISLVLVSSLAGLGFVLAFIRLAKLDLSSPMMEWATIFLLVFPISIVLFIPYTESLFLFLTVLCLYAARKKRWWLAGLFGGLATLTKQPGIFLIIPLAMELWAEGISGRRFTWKAMKKWAALISIPFAMGIWILFRNVVIEGIRFDFNDLQQSFLSIFLSSNADQITSSRPFAWPWQVIWEAILAAINKPDTTFHVALNLGGFIFITLLLALTWRFLRPSYRVYSLLIVLSDLFYYSFTISPTPIPSLFRHAYLAFPIFIGMPHIFQKTSIRIIFSIIGFLLFIVLIYAYTIERWIV